MRSLPRPRRTVCCLVLTLALAVTAAPAADTIDWADLPAPVADLDAGGEVRALARTGGTVYVATDTHLRVADLGAADPAWLGELALPVDRVLDVAAGGGTVVLALGAAGALVVDAADPADPRVAGSVPYRCDAVAFAGDLLCAVSSLGLVVYDMADPAAPTVVGTQGDAIPGLLPRLVARDGACWAVTQGRFGTVRGYDLADPALPAHAGSVMAVLDLTNVGKPLAAALAGDVLHLLVRTEWSDGTTVRFVDTRLLAIDVADPATPAKLGELVVSDTEQGTGLAVDASLAAVGLPTTVQLVDLADPAAPTAAALQGACGATAAPLALAGDRLGVGTTSLRVLDMTAPVVTPELGRMGLSGQYVAEPVISGAFLFVGTASMGEPTPGGMDVAGVAVYDVSDPAAPVPVTHVGGPWTATVNAVVGEYLYGDGLCHWPTDTWLSAPGTLPATVATPVLGTALYGAGDGLTIWDVSDPAAPAVAATLLPGRTVRHVAAEGATVAVLCADGLVLMDAADPLVPVERASLPLSGSYVRAALAGGWLALVGDDGYRLVDARAPGAPRLGAFLAEPGLRDVVMDGNVSYATSDAAGVVAIVHGPDGDAEVLGRHLADTHLSRGLVLAGGMLLAAHEGVWGWPGEPGTLVRLAPQREGTVATVVESFTLDWRGPVCHVELRLAGVAPVLRLVVRDGRGERVLAWRAAGDGTYTADDRGLAGATGHAVTYVVQTPGKGGLWRDLAERRTLVPAVATTLLAPAPNPFNPATTIAYVLAESGPVELAVFALDGRRVRTLVSGHRPAGPHELVWDGRDDRRRTVAAGLYLIRLETATTVTTRKAALVK